MTTQRGPWKMHASRIAYQCSWMKVYEQQVTEPGGNLRTYAYVQIIPSVFVLALDERNNAYLTREFRYAVAKETLEVVSGGVEQGESFLHAAKRELEEELGIRARRWTLLGRADPFPSRIDAPTRIYLARDLSFHAQNPEGAEMITPVKVPFVQLYEKIINNQIHHAQTIALVLKTKELFFKTEKISCS